MTVRILVGDAREKLRELPDESVQCCVCSPPYWGLRAYKGDPGMIGLEPTFDEHLENLVAVFREVRRVMRPDATLWLNYGDAYAANGGLAPGKRKVTDDVNVGGWRAREEQYSARNHGFKPKDLMMMPARVAMALQADGWWLRSEIVWHKPNPMPESVTDRPTSAHEKLFLLSRSAKYFYDSEAVRVPYNEGSLGRYKYALTDTKAQGHQPGVEKAVATKMSAPNPAGANLRNVWSIPTFGYSQAHFATFPPALVEPCIKAGTSEKGACAECGSPWVRMTNTKTRFESGSGKSGNVPRGKYAGSEQAESGTYDIRMGPVKETITTGWSPSCECKQPAFGAPYPTKPCVVLDPFGGSGTVGLVADRLQRHAILIEISADYAEMARRRIEDDAPLFATAG